MRRGRPPGATVAGGVDISRGDDIIRDDAISAAALTGFGDLVAELGGDPLLLLADAGLSQAALDDPDATISLDAVTLLYERAAQRLSCPDFGLRLAERRVGVPTSGLLAQLLGNAPTLGDMLRHATDHSRLYSPGVKVFLDHAPAIDRVLQRFDITADGPVIFDQFMENILLLVHRTVVHLTRGRARPREIWFSHARIAPTQAYSRRFAGTDIGFGQEYDGVFFAPEDMARPIADRDNALFEAEARAIGARFPASRRPASTRLRETLQAIMRHGLYRRADVARHMDISISALQRQLSRTGESFEGVRDDVRRQLALRYLARGDMPLSEIAPKLGYSELAVLSRSCRRWFGMTPAAVRRQLLAGQPGLVA